MLRRTAFAATLALLLGFAARAHAEEAGDEAVGPAAAEAAADSGDEAPARPARHKRRKSHKGGRFIGRVVPEDKLRIDPLPRPSGNLEMVSLANPDEKVKVNIYNPDGSYNLDALDQLNHVLRCRRTDTEMEMDPQLLTLLSHVYDHFGSKPLQIVSGYRNQRKQTSNHFKGRASDIRIAGVSSKKIEAFAETLDRGGMGIGIYPRSQFVHIDVRSPPSYRWIDYSPPNSNASEKRPPRGWKRKKLES
ncbi:MAG TPA: DUF882 domain-containing protein [Polyangia bacterium]|nr:DUF882 domain-containing protein [Polyangia bacterium]